MAVLENTVVEIPLNGGPGDAVGRPESLTEVSLT